MKKSLLALAVLGGITSEVSAQSSLTVYGIVDLAVRTVDNEDVGSDQSMISGGNNTSRLGFRGVEDLGDGLRAGFQLESGINADAGTNAGGAQFWDRESHLFIRAEKFGDLRLGRSQTPVYKIWSAADPFNVVGVGSVVTLYPAAASTAPNPIFAAFGTNDRTATSTTRANNMAIYSLPENLGGFVGTAFIAASEGSTLTTSARGLKVQGFTIGYVKGPLSLMGGYAKTRTPLGGTETFKDRSLAAIYDFGFVRASIAQRYYKFLDATQDILQVGVWVPVGAGTIKASYGRSNNKGTVGVASIDTRDAQSFGLGYQYDLSKRTALYGTISQLNNDSGSAVTISGGPTGMAAGGKSRGAEIGLRHNF